MSPHIEIEAASFLEGEIFVSDSNISMHIDFRGHTLSGIPRNRQSGDVGLVAEDPRPKRIA